MTWRSIDESDETVVLRGRLATEPESYERFRRRRGITPGAVAAFLHRLISWSIAAAAHLLVAALLLALYIEIRQESDTPLFARLHRGDSSDQAAPLEAPKFEEAKKEEKPDPVPEPPKPAPAVEAPQPAPIPTPEPPSPNPTAGPPVPDAKPAVVGGGANTSGGGAKPAVADKDIERDPTEAIRKRRAGELGKLRGGSDREILVVAGCYDRVQDVLDRLDIPHRTIQPEQLAKQDLSKCKALLINCHNQYSAGTLKEGDRAALEKEVVALEAKVADLRQRIDKTKERMALYKLNVELLNATSTLDEGRRRLQATADSATLAKNLNDFVVKGGYVFTSDWGLTLLQRAIPGYIMVGGAVGPRTVGIRPKSGNEQHPLLEEVFLEPSKGSTRTARRFDWDIDSSSYSIRVEKPDVVEVLVEAVEALKYPAVAVTFRHEKGRSLHVLSHFQKQATRHGDYALQNMLLNFLFERLAGGVPRAGTGAPAAVPTAPRAAPSEAFRAHTDETWGIALAVPDGWNVITNANQIVLRPADEGPVGARVTLHPADPSLAQGTDGWDEWLKKTKRGFEGRDPAAATTRRVQAFCSGCPALLTNWTVGKQAILIFAVAGPQATYQIQWSAPREEFAAWEAVFEKASRAFTILRK